MMRSRWLGSIAFALWLATLFLLQGALLEDPAAQSVVARLSPSGRLVALIRPLFTADYHQ
jgi:hypothetical protein